jgi:hypothetical protein
METLAPSILEIRNSFLEKFKNEKLDIISRKLTELFDVEKDPVKKIVLLASRVETVRKRIDQIHQDENKTKTIQESSNESSNENSNEEKVVQAENENEENKKSNSETWIRVIMKESTEVNGVRFPEGIQIDVTEDDSKKLIESGKAAIIS